MVHMAWRCCCAGCASWPVRSRLLSTSATAGLTQGDQRRGRGRVRVQRALAPVVAAALQARGIAVRPINFDGAIGSLAARPQAAAGADFFLSLHHDSLPVEELETWQWKAER